jgi:hypothetical protein
MEPGIFPNIPNSEYRAKTDFISSTAFKKAIITPQSYFNYINTPQEQTAAMYFGTASHANLLEGQDVTCAPKFDKRTKEGKEAAAAWEADNQGKLIFDWFTTAEANQKAVDQIRGMTDAVRSYTPARNLLTDGAAELSAFAFCPKTGVGQKARPDFYRPGDRIIVDYKTTTESVAPESFERVIFKYGYHISAAWYLRVMEIVTGKPHQDFAIIAVEKNPPHLVNVFVLKPAVINLGLELIDRTLPRLKECIERNEWPGYPERIHEIGIPTWAEQRELMALAEVES